MENDILSKLDSKCKALHECLMSFTMLSINCKELFEDRKPINNDTLTFYALHSALIFIYFDIPYDMFSSARKYLSGYLENQSLDRDTIDKLLNEVRQRFKAFYNAYCSDTDIPKNSLLENPIYRISKAAAASLGHTEGTIYITAVSAHLAEMVEVYAETLIEKELIPNNINSSIQNSTKVAPKSINKNQTNNSKSIASPKQKYCKNCGSPIDHETKKCAGCGKQYFKFSSFFMKLFCWLFITSIACYLTFDVTYDFQQETIESLRVYYTSRISELKETIESQDAQILDLNSKQKAEAEKIAFFDNNIALIPSNGKKYHTYNCHYFQSCEYFRVYHIKNARELGYTPCSECHPND